MSKEQLLRAMREAEAQDKSTGRGVMLTTTAPPPRPVGTEPTPLRFSQDSLVHGELPTDIKKKLKKSKGLKIKAKSDKRQARAKAKNGGKGFVPNRTKGRPQAKRAHLTNEARQPWVDLKISRRTWYRRIAKDAVPNSKR